MNKQIELSNEQFLALSVEIDVFTSHPKMDMMMIHDMRAYKAKIKEIVSNYLASKNTLIEKWGEKDPVTGDISIVEFFDEEKTKPNPKFKEFQSEIEPIAKKMESVSLNLTYPIEALKDYPQGDFYEAWARTYAQSRIIGFNNIFKLFLPKDSNE